MATEIHNHSNYIFGLCQAIFVKKLTNENNSQLDLCSGLQLQKQNSSNEVATLKIIQAISDQGLGISNYQLITINVGG